MEECEKDPHTPLSTSRTNGGTFRELDSAGSEPMRRNESWAIEDIRTPPMSMRTPPIRTPTPPLIPVTKISDDEGDREGTCASKNSSATFHQFVNASREKQLVHVSKFSSDSDVNVFVCRAGGHDADKPDYISLRPGEFVTQVRVVVSTRRKYFWSKIEKCASGEYHRSIPISTDFFFPFSP